MTQFPLFGEECLRHKIIWQFGISYKKFCLAKTVHFILNQKKNFQLLRAARLLQNTQNNASCGFAKCFHLFFTVSQFWIIGIPSLARLQSNLFKELMTNNYFSFYASCVSATPSCTLPTLLYLLTSSLKYTHVDTQEMMPIIQVYLTPPVMVVRPLYGTAKKKKILFKTVVPCQIVKDILLARLSHKNLSHLQCVRTSKDFHCLFLEPYL